MLNLSKQLTFKWFIFLLSLNFISLQSKDLQDIKIENLHIFYILQNAKVVISQDVLEKDDSAKEVGANSLNLINKEIVLLEEIIDGFDKGHLKIIENKFLRICNFFKDYDRIAPRDLRGFKKKLLKFDSEIQEYLTQKKHLSKDEIELCEKITDFNKMLLTCFLRYEFYGIDIFDRIIDTVIFRPFEWAQEHPYITLAFVTLVAAVVCYFYFFYSPKFLKNKNPDIDVTQIWIFCQEGAKCGAHAVYNLICFFRSKGDPEIAYKLANDKEEFARMCEEWSRLDEIVQDKKQDFNWLDIMHLIAMIRRYNETHPEEHALELGVNLTFPHAGNLNFDERPRANLNNGQPQYIILNTANPLDEDGNQLPKEKIEKLNGHWLPFMFVPDDQAKNGVRVFTANSLCNTNVTNSALLNALYNNLVH